MHNNVHFDKESYRHEIYTGSSNQRRVSRGFAPFIIDTVDRCLNNNRTLKERIPAILELGVGGGGSHLNWEKFSNARIYGIEYFHPDKVKEYFDTNNQTMTSNLEKRIKSYHHSEFLFKTKSKSTRVIYGYDAYAEESVNKIKELNFWEKFDVIVDDAAPNIGSVNGLMRVWKEHLTDTGIIISETPFGNGTEPVYSMPMEQKLEYCNILAQQGMICFDMSEYMVELGIDYMVPYMAFYSKNYVYYDNVLKKYEHNIVAGRENWK